MRILAIERDSTSCNQYRILGPMVQLREQGLAEVICLPEDANLCTDAGVEKVLQSDIILVPRPQTEEWFKFLQLCRKLGKVIISDYDDDPFNTSPLNPYYRVIGVEEVLYEWPDGKKEWLWQDGMKGANGVPGFFNIEDNIQRRDMFRLNFKKSDMITCTNELLRQQFLEINPNVAVLPNLIDLDLYHRLDVNKGDEVRIGWQGGVSHYEDLYMVHKAIKRILKKYPFCKFVYFGDYRFKGLFSDIDQNQLITADWVYNNAYHYKLACLSFDIGLCPIVDNVFNRRKSSIKWMEYSAVGCATVASNIPPYTTDIKNEKDGLLVGESEDEWFNAIEKLVVDKSYRKKLANNAYDSVYENYRADKFAYLWKDAYEKVLKGETVHA